MSSLQPAPPRLVAGAHLFLGADGAWRYVDPTGRFFRLRSEGTVLSELQPLLHGGVESCPGLDDAQTTQAVDALNRQGFVALPDDPSPLPDTCTVLVESDTAVGDQVISLLEPYVTVVQAPLEAADDLRPDHCVSCVGWLPDLRWRAVDGVLRSVGASWHRCYAEGRLWVIGPMTVPGRTATYSDTRGRILAAASRADELAGHWSYLDAGQCLPPVPELSTGAVAVIAGLMVADILAALASKPIPSEGYQLAFDPRTSELARHPVLPLPPVWSSPATSAAPAAPPP